MHDIRRGKTAVNVKTGPRSRAIVTGGAGTAGRAVTLSGSIFSYAIKQEIRADNPASGVEVPPDGKRDRVPSPDEYRRPGEALDDFEAWNSSVVQLFGNRAGGFTAAYSSNMWRTTSASSSLTKRFPRTGSPSASCSLTMS